MATKKEPNIPRLFAQLQAAGEDGNFSKALKIVEKILSVASDDSQALHCKVVCLIQLSKFQEANKLIDTLNKKADSPKYLFEKAYCQYRLEKYKESQQLLSKLPQSNPHVRELQAQIFYRLEEYQKATTTYVGLIKDCSDSFSSERAANYAAALSQSCRGDSEGVPLNDIQSLPTETMEQSFNVACCYLSKEKPSEAKATLEKAQEQCRESLLEDDYTEEEIEEELSVYQVQLGYALQMQGQTKESMAVYNAILKQKPDDVAQVVVTSNNIIVLNRDRDIFDSKKKVKVLAVEGSSKKLTNFQKLAILYNRCLFALQINQLEQCRELLGSLEALDANSDFTVLVKVALLNRERKNATCIETLDTHLRSRPNGSVLLYTTLAQLHMSQGHVDKVCSVLRSIPSLSRHLGALSVLVSLYTSAGDIDSAIGVLDPAMTYWLGQPKTVATQSITRQVMMENARYKLQHSRPEAAAEVLEEIRSGSPKDLQVLAMLVTAYSQYDAKKAEELSRSLAAVEMNQSIDVDTLEQMPSFKHTRRHLQKTEAATDHKDTAADKAVVTKPKKKRKRKPRLPKNYDPNVAPDPERWLPLRERSYYRKGKKKGVSATARGTQGTSAASASLMAQLDQSKPKAAATQQDAQGATAGIYKDETCNSSRLSPTTKALYYRRVWFGWNFENWVNIVWGQVLYIHNIMFAEILLNLCTLWREMRERVY